MRFFIKVVLPTLGGPTTETIIGGGSIGVRSTRGICCFLESTSCFRRNCLSALTAELKPKAFGLRCLSVEVFLSLAFFLSAFLP